MSTAKAPAAPSGRICEKVSPCCTIPIYKNKRRSITNLAVSLCVRLVWKYRSCLTSMHGVRRPDNGVTIVCQ